MSKIAELPVVPALRSVEDYARVSDEHGALISERAQLQDRLKDLARRWRETAAPAHGDEIGQQFLRQRFAGEPEPEDREELATQWRDCDRRLRQLNEAIRVHDQETFAPARGRAAAQIAQQVRPAYAAAVRALDQDCASLEEELQSLANFEAELHAAGGDLRALGAIGADFRCKSIKALRETIAERFER